MGTRNLSIAIIDGKVKIAQYGQWDGYLSCAGIGILEFIKNGLDYGRFCEALRKCEFISEEDIKALWTSVGANPNSTFVGTDIADKFQELYPELYRDMGYEVFSKVQNDGFGRLKNDYDFAADSLFCEYAYVLDMDNKCLEIYTGFNQEPLNEDERFYPLQIGNPKYYPVKLFKKMTFDEIKEIENLEIFIEDLDNNEED